MGTIADVVIAGVLLFCVLAGVFDFADKKTENRRVWAAWFRKQKP